ncbi:MAG: hypothetical protein KKD46_00930, partial [Euryarchaeota archaeon]|nr:hypothetical protein [Euryarchaeota archaeon]
MLVPVNNGRPFILLPVSSENSVVMHFLLISFPPFLGILACLKTALAQGFIDLPVIGLLEDGYV